MTIQNSRELRAEGAMGSGVASRSGKARMSVATSASALALALLSLSSHQAWAQDATAAAEVPDAAASANAESEVVIVTGVTRQTKKQSATFSINTLNRDNIEQLAPISTADLLGNIPGFFAEGSTAGEASNNITVRGLPATGGFRYAPQLIDGLPVFQEPDIPFMNNDVFIRPDIMTSRVEVVKGGPGGILYSNGLGATVNHVTRTGSQKHEGAYRLEVADYGFIRNELFLAGPIDKNWTFAVGGFYRLSQGIRDIGYTADKGGQIRGNLVWTSDDGSSKLALYGQYINDRTAVYNNLPIAVPGFTTPGTADNPIRIDQDTVMPIGIDFGHGTTLSPSNRYIYMGGEYGDRSVDMADGIHPDFKSFTVVYDKAFASGWNLKASARVTGGTSGFNALFLGNDAASAGTFLNQRWVGDVMQTAFDAQWQQDFNGQSFRSNTLGQYFNPLSEADFHANYRSRIEAAGFSNFEQVRGEWAAAQGKGVGVGGFYLDNGEKVASTDYLTFTIPWIVQSKAHSAIQNIQVQKSFDFLGDHNLTMGAYHSSYSDDYDFQTGLAISSLGDPSRLVELRVVDSSGNAISAAPVSYNGSLLPGLGGNLARGDFDGWAGYIQDHWETFDRRLKLDFGVRWETETADVVFQNRQCCTSIRSGAPGTPESSPALDRTATPGPEQKLNETYTGIGWSVGANYSLARNFAVYGLVSRSFRLPSFNDTIGYAQLAPKGDVVEHIWQYETGVRYIAPQWDVALALYYNEFQPREQTNQYQDIESPACGTDPANISTCPIAFESFYYGIKNIGTEIEFNVRPSIVPGLELKTNLVVQDPRVMGSSFRNVRAVLGTGGVTTGFQYVNISQDDRRPGRLAAVNLNFMPSWDLMPMTKLPLKLYGQYTYFSERYSNANDVDVTIYPEYYVINGGVLWDITDRMSFQVHVANLTDQLTFTEGDPLFWDLKAPNGTDNRGVARPLFGRSVRAFFNYRW